MVVSIVQPDDVAVAELVEDVNLHSEVGQLLVTLDCTDLGRGEPAVIFLPGLVNLTKGSIPELTDYFPILKGVLLLDMGETFSFLVVTLAYV